MRGASAFQTAVMIAVAVIAWTGVALQASVTVPARMALGDSAPAAVAHMLGYFAVLTNALVAVSLTVAVLQPRSRLGRFFAHPDIATGVTLSMVMIGAVYSIFLRKLWPSAGLQHIANVFLQYVAPWSYALYWAIGVPRFNPRLRSLGQWLVFPACYCLTVMVRRWASAGPPYFFLDVQRWGMARVLVNCGWIAAGFLALGLLLIALDHLKPRTAAVPGRSR